MNERIRELAEQAGFKLIRENCYDIASTMSVQEFAELIVQECVNVLHKNDLYTKQVSEVFCKHFGVE